MTSRRWHPWRDLRDREHITLAFDPVADLTGGGVYGRVGDEAAVVLSPSLTQTERRCALGHELVHDERGILAPHATPATMEKEERSVRLETARRLVPLDELEQLVATTVEVEPVTVQLVATEFDVTEPVAAEAIRQLQVIMLERDLDRAVRRHPTRG